MQKLFQTIFMLALVTLTGCANVPSCRYNLSCPSSLSESAKLASPAQPVAAIAVLASSPQLASKLKQCQAGRCSDLENATQEVGKQLRGHLVDATVQVLESAGVKSRGEFIEGNYKVISLGVTPTNVGRDSQFLHILAMEVVSVAAECSRHSCSSEAVIQMQLRARDGQVIWNGKGVMPRRAEGDPEFQDRIKEMLNALISQLRHDGILAS